LSYRKDNVSTYESKSSPKVVSELKKGKKHPEIVGHLIIKTMREDVEDNYKVIVFTRKPITHLGEFDPSAGWDYPPFGEDDGIEISEINKAEKLPASPRVMKQAMENVDPDDKWYAYEIKLRSKDTPTNVESIVSNWLDEEDFGTPIVWVYKLSDVKSSKSVPITKEMFEKALLKRGIKQP